LLFKKFNYIFAFKNPYFHKHKFWVRFGNERPTWTCYFRNGLILGSWRPFWLYQGCYLLLCWVYWRNKEGSKLSLPRRPYGINTDSIWCFSRFVYYFVGCVLEEPLLNKVRRHSVQMCCILPQWSTIQIGYCKQRCKAKGNRSNRQNSRWKSEPILCCRRLSSKIHVEIIQKVAATIGFEDNGAIDSLHNCSKVKRLHGRLWFCCWFRKRERIPWNFTKIFGGNQTIYIGQANVVLWKNLGKMQQRQK